MILLNVRLKDNKNKRPTPYPKKATDPDVVICYGDRLPLAAIIQAFLLHGHRESSRKFQIPP